MFAECRSVDLVELFQEVNVLPNVWQKIVVAFELLI